MAQAKGDDTLDVDWPRRLEALKLGSEAAKNFVSLVRDTSIVVFLVLFILNADSLTNWMRSNNIDSINVGIAELKTVATQAETASEAAEAVRAKAGAALSELTKLKKRRPDLSNSLKPIEAALQDTTASADDASQAINQAARGQLEVLAKADPVVDGWVSHNFLEAGAQSRPGSSTKVIEPRNLAVRSGPGTEYTRLTVLPPGTSVRIIEGPNGNWVRISTGPAETR